MMYLSNDYAVLNRLRYDRKSKFHITVVRSYDGATKGNLMVLTLFVNCNIITFFVQDTVQIFLELIVLSLSNDLV